MACSIRQFKNGEAVREAEGRILYLYTVCLSRLKREPRDICVCLCVW